MNDVINTDQASALTEAARAGFGWDRIARRVASLVADVRLAGVTA